MRLQYPRNSRRLLVSVVVFSAVLGLRLGPWPVGEPVADAPMEIVPPVLPVRFRAPAAVEILPKPRRGTRIVHHTAARHLPQHLGHHAAGAGHS